MIESAFQSLKWLISFSLKIGRVVPRLTLLIVVLTLISQVSALLASLLPLKVVILLGSDGVPRYIPESVAAYGKDLLIGIFSGVTVGFFLLHLVAEKLIGLATQSATDKLLKRSRKLVLFEKQDEVAANAYLRFSRAVSGGVFFLLGFILLIGVYPDMAAVLSGYVVLTSLIFWILIRNSGKFQLRMESRLADTLKLVAGIGFFMIFGFLVLDFIMLDPPGVIAAIVSMLLSRIMLQRFTSGLVDFSFIGRQRTKLEPLFFHGKVLMAHRSVGIHGIWSLLEPDYRPAWIESLFSEYVNPWPGYARSEWYQTGVTNVIGLKVFDKSGGMYLVKVFDTSRKGLAVHEATLVGENLQALPSPEFIANTNVNEFHCLVYRFPKGRHPDPDKLRNWIERARGRVMGVEPSETLIELYTRSKAMLWQRLSLSIIDDLCLCASSDEQTENAAELGSRFFFLQDVLKKMPLGVVLPDIKPSSIFLSDDSENIYIVNWTRWGLDPIGSGWRVESKRLGQIQYFLEEASGNREALRTVSVAQVELAALASALEQRCVKQQYSDAFELLPELLDRLRQLEGVSSVK